MTRHLSRSLASSLRSFNGHFNSLFQCWLTLRPHDQSEQIGTHRGQKPQIQLSMFSAGGKNFEQLAWWLVGGPRVDSGHPTIILGNYPHEWPESANSCYSPKRNERQVWLYQVIRLSYIQCELCAALWHRYALPPAWRICVFDHGDPFFGESLSLRQKPRTATTLTISSGSFISSRTIFLSSFA